MHGRRGSGWGNAAVQKTNHTWSINPDPSGAVSQKDQLYPLGWIASSLLTATASSKKSLIQLSLFFQGDTRWARACYGSVSLWFWLVSDSIMQDDSLQSVIFNYLVCWFSHFYKNTFSSGVFLFFMTAGTSKKGKDIISHNNKAVTFFFVTVVTRLFLLISKPRTWGDIQPSQLWTCLKWNDTFFSHSLSIWPHFLPPNYQSPHVRLMMRISDVKSRAVKQRAINKRWQKMMISWVTSDRCSVPLYQPSCCWCQWVNHETNAAALCPQLWNLLQDGDWRGAPGPNTRARDQKVRDMTRLHFWVLSDKMHLFQLLTLLFSPLPRLKAVCVCEGIRQYLRAVLA